MVISRQNKRGKVGDCHAYARNDKYAATSSAVIVL